MQNVIKNIYDRLYRKSVNVSKEDIAAKIAADYPEATELTDEQKSAVVAWFVDKQSKMTVVGVEPGLAATNQNQNPHQPQAEPIGVSQSKSIVLGVAESMSLDLKSSQIITIARQLYNQQLDATTAVKTATTLLKQYIDKQEANYTKELESSITELVDHAKQSYTRRSSQTTQHFNELQADLEAASQAYKRGTKDFITDLQTYFQAAES